MDGKRAKTLFRTVGLLALLGVIASPAVGGSAAAVDERLLSRLSGSVVTTYYLTNPDRAPAHLQGRFEAVRGAVDRLAGQPNNGVLDPPVGDRFNLDVLGLPQNEESIALCHGAPTYLLGGTNDYRGLVDFFHITGWHLSADGGVTVANEGLLPDIQLSSGEMRGSGGDPVSGCFVEEGGPNFYATSLNYDPFDPFGQPNAIGVYQTDLATLLACPGGSDPSCWPNRRPAAESKPGHFLDKEWMDVGDTGDGTHVWITYSDFSSIDPCCFADIMAVRCTADLGACTDPMNISETDPDVQFSDVTIGADGRTYITWAQIKGEIEGEPQTFGIKMRVAEPGCDDISCFGPIREVAGVDLAIPFGGFLQGNDFRVATYPVNAVKLVEGEPRVFVAWDECTVRILDETVCEEPRIKAKFSDDFGATWSQSKILSRGGVNYFPTIAIDPLSGKIVVAWFTNRFDNEYQNANDVEMVTIQAPSFVVTNRQRVTTDPSVPNEPEADPFLGGFFIGDYIEVDTRAGTAWVHYNMNIRDVAFLGEGLPVPQQDNFLTKLPT